MLSGRSWMRQKSRRTLPGIPVDFTSLPKSQPLTGEPPMTGNRAIATLIAACLLAASPCPGRRLAPVAGPGAGRPRPRLPGAGRLAGQPATRVARRGRRGACRSGRRGRPGVRARPARRPGDPVLPVPDLGRGAVAADELGALRDAPGRAGPRQGPQVDAGRRRGPRLHPGHQRNPLLPRRGQRRAALAPGLRGPVPRLGAGLRDGRLSPGRRRPGDRPLGRRQGRGPAGPGDRQRRRALAMGGRRSGVRLPRGGGRRGTRARDPVGAVLPRPRCGHRAGAVASPLHHAVRPEHRHARPSRAADRGPLRPGAGNAGRPLRPGRGRTTGAGAVEQPAGLALHGVAGGFRRAPFRSDPEVPGAVVLPGRAHRREALGRSRRAGRQRRPRRPGSGAAGADHRSAPDRGLHLGAGVLPVGGVPRGRQPTWAHPALAGDRLLVKDKTHLACWWLPAAEAGEAAPEILPASRRASLEEVRRTAAGSSSARKARAARFCAQPLPS